MKRTFGRFRCRRIYALNPDVRRRFDADDGETGGRLGDRNRDVRSDLNAFTDAALGLEHEAFPCVIYGAIRALRIAANISNLAQVSKIARLRTATNAVYENFGRMWGPTTRARKKLARRWGPEKVPTSAK